MFSRELVFEGATGARRGRASGVSSAACLRRVAVAGAVLLCAWLLPASRSEAGVYDVYSCRIPYGAQAGAPAPLQVAEGGGEVAGEWDVDQSGKTLVSQTCDSSDGGLIAGLRANEVHGDTDMTTWRFTAPEGETIKEATLWRAGDADGGEGYLFWLAAPNNPTFAEIFTNDLTFDACAYAGGCKTGQGDTKEPLSKLNQVAVPPENLGESHLYINAACSLITCASSPGDGEGFAAVVRLYAADMLLEETEAPSFSNLTGGLGSDEPLSGEASLTFEAQDQGSGVYQQVVEVDGSQIERSTIDEAEGRCKPVSEAGVQPQAFLYPRPCPSTAEGHVTLDTTKLTDGTHELRVSVTDAAGNSTTVLERQIDVANHATSPGGGEEPKGSGNEAEKQGKQEPAGGGGQTGGQSQGTSSGTDDQAGGSQASGEQGAAPQGAPATPNGSPASAAAKLTASWVAGGSAAASGARHGAGGSNISAAYGHAQTLRGRLTGAGGEPIAGALIQVSSRASYGGARAATMHALRTGKAGGFELRLPADSSSRSIELGYADTVGGKAVATRTLTLRVTAGVQLKVTPRTSAAGQAITLSGRVLGGPIPHGGKQVVLEARSTGTPWLQFEALHTGGNGRFHATHRFRLPGPIRYRFRAVCPREADFPFLAGKSRVLGVWER